MSVLRKAKLLVQATSRIYGVTPYFATRAVVAATVEPARFHVWARAWAASLLEIGHVTTAVRGVEGVDWDKPLVLMSNHQSLYDIPVLFHRIPADIHFLSKKELRSVPFMGWSMEKGGFVFIDRKDPVKSKESIERAAQDVINGKAVAIFPEGTRSGDGTLQPFKKGGFVLAIKAGAQIVPVWLDGSHGVCPKGSLVVYPGHVEVRVGRPVDPKQFPLEAKEGLMEAVREELVRLSSIPPLEPTGARPE
jgi:1-acyl-sn-glycerol-3-phosphate acyltransferase